MSRPERVTSTQPRAARPHGTAALPVLEATRRRYREGRERIGEADWRAWKRTVAIGAVAMLGVMWLLVQAGQALDASGALDWEAGFLLWLGSDGPLRFSSAVFFQTFGTDITLVILLVSTAGIAAWNRRPATALSLILAAVVADLVGRAGWLMWSRERPDLLHEGVASPGFHSFPSGHTSKTMAVYGLLTVLWLRRSASAGEWVLALLLLAFIVIVVPLGRMTMGVHWPSDVVAGWIIGLAWLGILVYALRYEDAGRVSSTGGRWREGSRSGEQRAGAD